MIDTTTPTATRSAFLDDVMRQSEVAILAGSALPIDRTALAGVLAQLRPEVSKQLKGPDLATDQARWYDDARNVILASTMFGTIATCVARLNRKDVVDEASLRVAYEVVRNECRARFGPEGCWCGC